MRLNLLLLIILASTICYSQKGTEDTPPYQDSLLVNNVSININLPLEKDSISISSFKEKVYDLFERVSTYTTDEIKYDRIIFEIEMDKKSLSNQSIDTIYIDNLSDSTVFFSFLYNGKEQKFPRSKTIINSWENNLNQFFLIQEELKESTSGDIIFNIKKPKKEKNKIDISIVDIQIYLKSFTSEISEEEEEEEEEEEKEEEEEEEEDDDDDDDDETISNIDSLFNNISFEYFVDIDQYINPANDTIVFKFSNYETAYEGLEDTKLFISTIDTFFINNSLKESIKEIHLITKSNDPIEYLKYPSDRSYDKKALEISYLDGENGELQNKTIDKGDITLLEQELLKLHELKTLLNLSENIPHEYQILFSNPIEGIATEIIIIL